MSVTLSASDTARFWAKVNIDGPIPEHRPELGPCWVWTAATFKSGGYGAFMTRAGLLRAHAVGFYLCNGWWAAPCVLHHCDNPACVRGSHLFEGTRGDNNRDAAQKGRKPSGHDHWNDKLSEQDIQRIRALREAKVPIAVIARSFGIARLTVYRKLFGDSYCRH